MTAPRTEAEQLREIILWALGERGEFPEQPEGQRHALYWWRKELRRRVETVRVVPPVAPQTQEGRVSRRVPPSYKGVTYRDGAWWNGACRHASASAVVMNVNGLTDDDHAPLLALRDAPPSDPVREAVRAFLIKATDAVNRGFTDLRNIGLEDDLVALLAERAAKPDDEAADPVTMCETCQGSGTAWPFPGLCAGCHGKGQRAATTPRTEAEHSGDMRKAIKAALRQHGIGIGTSSMVMDDVIAAVRRTVHADDARAVLRSAGWDDIAEYRLTPGARPEDARMEPRRVMVAPTPDHDLLSRALTTDEIARALEYQRDAEPVLVDDDSDMVQGVEHAERPAPERALTLAEEMERAGLDYDPSHDFSNDRAYESAKARREAPERAP